MGSDRLVSRFILANVYFNTNTHRPPPLDMFLYEGREERDIDYIYTTLINKFIIIFCHRLTRDFYLSLCVSLRPFLVMRTSACTVSLLLLVLLHRLRLAVVVSIGVYLGAELCYLFTRSNCQ